MTQVFQEESVILERKQPVLRSAVAHNSSATFAACSLMPFPRRSWLLSTGLRKLPGSELAAVFWKLFIMLQLASALWERRRETEQAEQHHRKGLIAVPGVCVPGAQI